MKKSLLTGILLALCHIAAGQYTLEECWQKARENYPLIARMGLIDQAKEYTLANASKGYLPQFQLSARASYQSDVTSLPISVPGVEVPVMPKDQYDAHLELSQLVWDGGRIGARKRNTETAAQVNRQSLEVDLYGLHERVSQLFFGILLADKQLEQNRLLREDLGRTHKVIAAYIASGIANRSDLDAVEVEQIDSEQNRLTISSLRAAYVRMLSVMTGIAEGNLKLVSPAPPQVATDRIDRPELWLLNAQDENYKAQLKAVSAQNRPVFNLYAQAGYGQPGLNMLKSGFEPYGLAGIRLTWSFGNYYTVRNDRRLIENSRRNIDVQRETFLFNTRLQLIQQRRQADNIRELMRQDDRLVELRGNIRRAADAKVAAGTMTTVELMREVMAENLARQNRALHEVQLLMALYDMKITVNE